MFRTWWIIPLDSAITISDPNTDSRVLTVKSKVKSSIWYPAIIRLFEGLTGNVNMIEKLVLGGTETGELPILSPTR